MKILNHLVASDNSRLATINNDWPYQFLSEYTRLQKHYSNSEFNIVYDDLLDAYLPIKLYKTKGFHFGQIEHAPVRDGEELSPDEQLDFFERFISYTKVARLYSKLIQPPPSGIVTAVPQGSKYCEFGSYITDLANQSDEEILNNFDNKYRKAISHSIRNNARIEVGRHVLEDFYNLYSKTMKRAGMHLLDREYFNAMYDYLGENRIYSAVVYDEFAPIGAVFIISTLYSANVMHAGSFGKTKLYGSMKYLNYEMMKLMKRNSVRKYDFVGVRINNKNPALEGIFKFKRGFGGELKKGFLWKIDINPSIAFTFSLLQNLRLNKKPLPDIIDQVQNENAH